MSRQLLRPLQAPLLSVVVHGIVIGGLVLSSKPERRAAVRRPPVRVSLVAPKKPETPEVPPKEESVPPKRSKPEELAAPMKKSVVSRPPRRERTIRRAEPARRTQDPPSVAQPPDPALAAAAPGPRRFTVALSATISTGGVSVPASLGGSGTARAAPLGTPRGGSARVAGEDEPADSPREITAMPRLVSQPSLGQMRAAYPVDARQRGIEGDVQLKILVAASGEVVSVRVLRPAGHGFDEAARQLLRKFRFKAARRGGVAVALWIPWTYKFRLNG